MTDAQGRRIPFFKTVRWQFGGGDYVGFLRNYYASRHAGNKNILATFRLGRAGHVTEMRSRRRIGRKDHVTYPIDRFSVQVFSVLPYEVERIKVDAPARLRQGDPLRVRLEVRTRPPASVGNHVLRVDMVNPKGHAADYYSQNLIAAKGRCEFVRPLALNEAPGRWTLRVRDAASCVESASSIVVEEAE